MELSEDKMNHTTIRIFGISEGTLSQLCLLSLFLGCHFDFFLNWHEEATAAWFVQKHKPFWLQILSYAQKYETWRRDFLQSATEIFLHFN